MKAIYHAQANGERYVQFLPDGRAVIARADNSYQTGLWSTDGSEVRIMLPDKRQLNLPRTGLRPVEGVPAGTRLVVRLLNPLSSYKAKENQPVEAILVSPASISEKIFLPQGALFHGVITKAHAVGWAFKHETAALTVNFTSVQFPGGQSLPIHTLLEQVENSQETVNKTGAIQGIRSTGTLGHSAESKIASVASFDPVAYLFTTVSATAALGFAEPEILYPAGTELMIEVESPLVTSKTFPSTVPLLADSQAQQDKLVQFIRALPFRTMTAGSNKPSDLTNLVFLGTADAVRRAFEAADWVPTDQLTAHSTFTTMRTLGGNQSYKQAPMSVLLLDERAPIFTLTKTTNTFNSRHHIRIFNPNANFAGVPALTASSTQDIGIAFSGKQKTFIHVIDQHIDNERSKVVNDLELTGCVEAAELIPRPWVPNDAYNSTGDKLQTDSQIAVLRLSNCTDPKKSPSGNAVPPNRFQRVTRDTMLTLRNDVVRGNLGYQGYSVGKLGYNYFAHKDELKPDTGAWEKTDLSGARFKGVGAQPVGQPAVRPRLEQNQIPKPDPSVVAAQQSHRWDPPHYEIGINGGYLFYPKTRSEAGDILLTPQDLASGLPLLGAVFADEIGGGFSAGIYFTADTWKWISNQFSYNYQRGKYLLITGDFGGANDSADFTSRRVGLVTRQFDYNVLFNLRPPRSRWRPYLAVGPALQLIALSDAPLTKAPRAFRLGLQNVGALVAAFNFAGNPPLEGGGIFRLGFEYGGGISFRVHPRITLNADFRETWSRTPHFINDTYTSEYFGNDVEDYDVSRDTFTSQSNYRTDRTTLGVAFTF